MSRLVQHRFPGTAGAPGTARSALVSALDDVYGGQAPARAVADAAVVVSELVTNAVRAGAMQIEVDYVFDDGALLIRVSDDAPGLPARRHPSPLEANGRGLQLVEALARSWHTVPRGAAGKSVQASIALGAVPEPPAPRT